MARIIRGAAILAILLTAGCGGPSAKKEQYKDYDRPKAAVTKP